VSNSPPPPKDPPAPGRDAILSFTPDLVALLAHQLMNPVSTVIALAQSLSRRVDGMDTEEVRTQADRIGRAGRRLAALIESMMARARTDGGAMRLDAQCFDMRPVIERVCHALAENEPAGRLEVSLADMPPLVEGDPVLLEQALAVVVENALKYSAPDRPVSVSAGASEDAVQVTVRDEGIGIPSEDLQQLGRPFFRARNTQNPPQRRAEDRQPGGDRRSGVVDPAQNTGTGRWRRDLTVLAFPQ
jgi:two-component system sensor histidine kinase SenX3